MLLLHGVHGGSGTGVQVMLGMEVVMMVQVRRGQVGQVVVVVMMMVMSPSRR